jgi:hypothetical protein
MENTRSREEMDALIDDLKKKLAELDALKQENIEKEEPLSPDEAVADKVFPAKKAEYEALEEDDDEPQEPSTLLKIIASPFILGCDIYDAIQEHKSKDSEENKVEEKVEKKVKYVNHLNPDHEKYTKVISGYEYLIPLQDWQDRFHCEDSMDDKLLQNAIDSYAPEVREESVIGLFDNTLFGNGSEGYIFTDESVYYKECFTDRAHIMYKDIAEAFLRNTSAKSNYDKYLVFRLKDGSVITWKDCYLDKVMLLEFFEEILAVVNGEEVEESDEENGKESIK